jgi:nitrile hydratase
MHGFGPIPTDDEQFHADWERRVFGLVMVLGTQGYYTLGAARHAVERLPPAHYLSNSYFERWLDARLLLLTEAGVLDADDLAALGDRADAVPDDATLDPSTRESLLAAIQDRVAADTDTTCQAEDPQFAEGDSVKVRSDDHGGHTRCPAYVRRARGTIHAVRGSQPYPEADAAGDERYEPLYTVSFDATELWGEAAHGGDAVSVDLWEPYLRAADVENV